MCTYTTVNVYHIKDSGVNDCGGSEKTDTEKVIINSQCAIFATQLKRN